MKKIKKYIIMILLSLLVESMMRSNTISNPIIVKADSESNNKELNSLLYNRMYWALKYAEENDVPIYNFKERKKVGKWITNDNYEKKLKSAVCLTTKVDETKYVKTLEDTDLIYCGKLNDDAQPEGIGIIFEIFYELDYTDPDLLIKYIGNFKNGQYSGYGVEFAIPDPNDTSYGEVSEEFVRNNLNFFNDVIYEGEFKKGKYSGKGNYFINHLSDLTTQRTFGLIEEEDICADNVSYSMEIGEFKKNKLNGKGKVYYEGKLVYDGEFKNDKMSGKGKQYSVDTGKLIYKGEFADNEYDGKGTLYDENGKLVHKGKFRNGDVK